MIIVCCLNKRLGQEGEPFVTFTPMVSRWKESHLECHHLPRLPTSPFHQSSRPRLFTLSGTQHHPYFCEKVCPPYMKNLVAYI